MFKIYIGNLDKRTTAEHVRRLFVTFPELNDLVLAEDPKTGQSRCFAIAMFKDAERGRAAIAALAGRRLHGRPLTVAEALTKKAKKEAGLDQPGGSTGPRRAGLRGGPGGPVEERSSFRSTGAPGPRGAGEDVRRPGQRPWHRSGGGRPFGGGAGFGGGPGADRRSGPGGPGGSGGPGGPGGPGGSGGGRPMR